MKNEKKKNIRLNLTLSEELHEKLKDLSERDHLRISTWTRQFLTRQVDEMIRYEEFSNDPPF